MLNFSQQVHGYKTRMHSSRMCTTHSSSHPGGSPPCTPQEQAPLPPEQTPTWEQTPPDQAPPEQTSPQEQTPPWSRHPPGSRLPRSRHPSLPWTESQMPCPNFVAGGNNCVPSVLSLNLPEGNRSINPFELSNNQILTLTIPKLDNTPFIWYIWRFSSN